MREYWDSVVEGTKAYQMGPLSHRVYLLDLLAKYNVNSLLDIGCGTAPLYDLIINSPEDRWDNIIRYKGVDPSESMIQSCKFNLPHGDFEVQDATDLKELDDSWDAVVMMHSLDYVYDYAKAIEEMARVAEKYILIVLWRVIDYGENAETRLNNTINPDDGLDWKYARLQEFAWNDLKKIFDDLGLEIVFKIDDEQINEPGKTNTLILLRK